jgi:hypothetical protein
MKQIARNLTDATDGFLHGKRDLIFDRDPVFTQEFRTMFKVAGVKPVVLTPRAPNLNAHVERFVRPIKESCLSRIIFFGEQSLRWATRRVACGRYISSSLKQPAGAGLGVTHACRCVIRVRRVHANRRSIPSAKGL